MLYAFIISVLCHILSPVLFINGQETTETDYEFTSTSEESPSKLRDKMFIIFLPPVFNIIGITVLVISALTTLFCVAYCVFLPWAHALSTSNDSSSTFEQEPQPGSKIVGE